MQHLHRTLYAAAIAVSLLCSGVNAESPLVHHGSNSKNLTPLASSASVANNVPKAKDRIIHKRHQPQVDNNSNDSNASSLFRGGASGLVANSTPERVWDVVKAYWYLGLLGFGGPPTHVALLRQVVTEHQKWMSDKEFMELLSVAGGLPGPSSTQLLIITAVSHAGLLGGLAAFVLWVLPGFLALGAAGKALYKQEDPPVWLKGIAPSALALTLQAAMRFWNDLDSLQKTIATVSCMLAILINSDMNIPKMSANYIFPSLLALGGLTTLIAGSLEKSSTPTPKKGKRGARAVRSNTGGLSLLKDLPLWGGFVALAIWAALYFSAPLVWDRDDLWDLLATSFRVGSVVFGGGPVIVPLLSSELIPELVKEKHFYRGVGLAQSFPGPFFNLAAYLGASNYGWKGAVIAHVGLFAPGLLLLFAALPFWSHLRQYDVFHHVVRGVSASIVGLIGSAAVSLYSGSIKKGANAMVLAFSSGLLAQGVPPPLVLVFGALVGAGLSTFDLGQKLYGSERWQEMAHQEVLEALM